MTTTDDKILAMALFNAHISAMYRSPPSSSSMEKAAADPYWLALAKAARTAPITKEAGPPPIYHAIVCKRCGSLIDYGKGQGGSADVKASHLSAWCPACAPNEPWRRGVVLVEGPDASRLREEGRS